ncbi:type IV pilus modification PilV family protein [Thermodesulfobium sp.]
MDKRGVTLIEILVVSVFLLFALVVLAWGLSSSLKASTNNYILNQANILADSQMESLRALALGSSVNIQNSNDCVNNGTICFNLTATRSKDPNSNCDLLNVIVSDTANPARFKSINLQSEACQ